MNLGSFFKSTTKAVSKIDWGKVAKVTTELTVAVAGVWDLIRDRTKSDKPKSEPIPDDAMDENVVTTINEHSSKINTLGEEIDILDNNIEKQAKIVSKLTEQIVSLTDLLHTVSLRLNIFIGLSIISIILSIVVLTWY